MREIITRAVSTLNKDEGIGNDFQLFETLTWVLFLIVLKHYESLESIQAELQGDDYESIFQGEYDWDEWADESNGLTGGDLLKFMTDSLFPHLRSLAKDDHLSQITRAMFQRVRLYPQSGYKLKEVLDEFCKINLNVEGGKAELQRAFIDSVETMMLERQKPYRFYTPKPLVRLVLDLVQPDFGKTVYDPAFGTGGFLLEAASRLKNQVGNSPERLRWINEESVQGQEKDSFQFVIGLMNLFLADLSLPKVSNTNTLTIDIRQITSSEQYDRIYCNPTFDSDEDSSLGNRFPIATDAVELLFLQHIEKSLSQNGEAALLVPEGILFRGSGAYRDVKKNLLDKCNLHSIISLPHLGVKTSLLLFSRPGPTKEIWLYDVPLMNGRALTKRNGLKDEHFEELRAIFKEKPNTERSKTVSKDEVEAAGYNLSVSNYIESSTAEEVLLEPDEYVEQIEEALQNSSKDIKLLREAIKEE